MMIFSGILAALLIWNIYLCLEMKYVTTIYLSRLLFLCHCDLDFDVKEAEKSTFINTDDKNWLSRR